MSATNSAKGSLMRRDMPQAAPIRTGVVIFTSLVLLAACAGQTSENPPEAITPQAAEATSEQLAAAQEQWAGTWSGDWGKQDGKCVATIEVSDVTPTQAVATYTYSPGCGSNVTGGSQVVKSAKINGDVLTMRFRGGSYGVRLTQQGDGTAEGSWWGQDRARTAKTTFYKVEGS